MFSSVQTLDVERYLIQCRRLLLDEIQRSGAGLYGAAGERPVAPASLGPATSLRPALCIASGMALGASLGRVLPVAAALELFQAGITADPLSAPLELAVQRVCARMGREALEGGQLQQRAYRAPLSARDELRRLHKQIGWGAFIPAVLLGSLSAGVQPDVVAAMARYGLLLAIASHSSDSDVRQTHARRARLLLRRRLGQLAASVHKDFLTSLVERCSQLPP
jgi:hypothetical protein